MLYKLLCVIFAIVMVNCLSTVLSSDSNATLNHHKISKKHIAICLVGQLMRTEIESKIKNIIQYNNDLDDTHVQVIGVLDTGVNYSNGVFQNTLSSCYINAVELQAYFRNEFSKYGIKVHNMIKEPIKITISNATRSVLYKYRADTSTQMTRIANHIRQFYHDSSCYDMMRRIEINNNMIFDAVIRIRDNALVAAPIDIIKSLELYNHQKVILKGCNSYGGYSDKVWIIPRLYMEPALSHVANDMMEGQDYLNGTYNSEEALYRVWNHYGVQTVQVSAQELPIIDARCIKMGNGTTAPVLERYDFSFIFDSGILYVHF